jgi:hypothetical protein
MIVSIRSKLLFNTWLNYLRHCSDFHLPIKDSPVTIGNNEGNDKKKIKLTSEENSSTAAQRRRKNARMRENLDLH